MAKNKRRQAKASSLISIVLPAVIWKQHDTGYLPSSETVNFFLPFALRAASTFRPFTDSILFLNPCLFFLFLFDGWKVLFIVLYFRGAKVKKVSLHTNRMIKKIVILYNYQE